MNPGGAEVFFVTSGGSGEGLGHVARTAVLARELERRHKPYRCYLAGDAAARQLLEGELSAPRIEAWGPGAIPIEDAGWVVIDTRRPLRNLLERAKAAAVPTLVVDSTQYLDQSDLSVLPILHGEPSSHPRLRQGGEYCILAETYRDQDVPPYPGERNILLVTLGGADPNAWTEGICESVALVAVATGSTLERHCVVGPAFRDAEAISRRCSDAGWKVHSAVPRKTLRDLMAQSVAAVAGFGTSVYDLAFMGVPMLYWTHHRSDIDDARRLESRGIGAWAGAPAAVDRAGFRKQLTHTLFAPDWCRETSENGKRALGSGLGAARILDTLFQEDRT